MLAISQAIKRRKRLLLTLTGLAAILLAIGGLLYWHSRESLLEFVDQDLRELDDSQRTGLGKLLGEYLPDAFPGPRTRLNRVLERILPEEFRPSAIGRETWYIWRLKIGSSFRFVVFQFGRPFRLLEHVAIHFVDTNGNYKGRSVIYVGYEYTVTDTTLLHHELLDAPVIEIATSLWVGNGNSHRHIYALFENRVSLLRVEDLNGKLVAADPDRFVGPPPLTRTAEEWEELLLSTDRGHILEALTWIGSEHCFDGVRDEAVKDARLAEAVRKRPAVQRRIAELTLSENRWVREAAVLAQESLPK